MSTSLDPNLKRPTNKWEKEGSQTKKKNQTNPTHISRPITQCIESGMSWKGKHRCSPVTSSSQTSQSRYYQESNAMFLSHNWSNIGFEGKPMLFLSIQFIGSQHKNYNKTVDLIMFNNNTDAGLSMCRKKVNRSVFVDSLVAGGVLDAKLGACNLCKHILNMYAYVIELHLKKRRKSNYIN